MSTSCITCGLCQQACPKQIKLSEFFILLAEENQALFDYVPGRDPKEKPPIREFYEETGLLVEITGIVAVHSNFHDTERQTVGIWFSGNPIWGEPEAGDDLVELGFFSAGSIPQLAFPTDRLVIDELIKGGRL